MNGHNLNDTDDVRNFLLNQMVRVANGKMEIGHAKAVCNLAQQVYNTIKLEMQYSKLQENGGAGNVSPVSWVSQKRPRHLKAA